MLLAGGCLEAVQKPKPATNAVAQPDASLLKARWRVLGARPLGLYYHFADARALKSLEVHASQITLLGPQSFWVDADGIVHGQVPPRVMEIARRAKLPVMPLLINPHFDRPTASALLRHPHAQERAAMYLAYLARRDNYVGWQLDLENIDPADQQRYTQFVARVAARLHRENRLLSVAVVPRLSDAPPGASPSGEFRTGEQGAPYDFRALSRVVDFMVLMTYNHHGNDTPPGPVAGYNWVKAALDYAVQRVPRAKLLLGIPFYGREWVSTSQGTSSRSLAFQDVRGMLDRPEIKARWDERSRTGWFEYRDDSGLHTAWYEDSKSLNEKLQLMQEYQLRGFAAWRLGVEDAKFWSLAVLTRKSASPASARRGRKLESLAAPAPPRSRPD
jgi:spore germination protein YaaH